MDYYTITYFHIFYIPHKYEAFALILACEIYHLVCKRALETFRPFNMSHASKKIARTRFGRPQSTVRNCERQFETDGDLFNSDQNVFYWTKMAFILGMGRKNLGNHMADLKQILGFFIHP